MNATRTDAWVTAPERDLTSVEAALLRYVLEREAPEHVAEVDALKVVGQCRCGACPTVIFQSPGIRRTRSEVAAYAGRNKAGVNIGIAVQLADGKLFELEGWSLDGQEPITWPELETLRPI
jgi:hypothetical protein